MDHARFATRPSPARSSTARAAAIERTVCDFWPKWHAKSGKLLGTGHTVVYQDNKVKRVRPPRDALFDLRRRAKQELVTHEDPRRSPTCRVSRTPAPAAYNAVDLAGRRHPAPDLLQEAQTETQYSVTVLRCKFDGENPDHTWNHGDELTIPVKRGLYEPSLTSFGGRFYLTLRNDDHGYVSVSDDAANFSEPTEVDLRRRHRPG